MVYKIDWWMVYKIDRWMVYKIDSAETFVLRN